MFKLVDHILKRAARILKASTASALCLLSLHSVVVAQEDEAAHVRFGITANYADLLTFTYSDMLYKMQVWDASSGGQDALDTLETSDVIPEGFFPRLDGRKVTDWGVRARLCDDFLVVYYATNNFKSNIKPAQIRAAQRVRYMRDGRVNVSGAPRLLGLINENSLTTQLGKEIPIPACIDTDYATPLPRGGVAMMGNAIAKGLYFQTLEFKRFRTIPCESPKLGVGIRQERTTFKPVSRTNKLVGEITHSAWTAVPGRTHCREPRDAWFYAPDQTCQKTVAGKVHPAAATYRYRTKEIKNPDDPYKVITVVVDKNGSLTSNPRGELYFDFCDSAPVQFNVDTDFTKTEETRQLACQDVYPVPAYRSVIKYTDGTYIEQRFKKVLTQSYDWDRAPIDVTSYTDWQVKEDTCSRLLRHHEVVKTKTAACTKAGDIGSMNYESLEKYYKQDFATYGYERTYASSHQFIRRGEWTLKSNTCRRPAPPRKKPNLYKSCHEGLCTYFTLDGWGRDSAVTRRVTENGRDLEFGGDGNGAGSGEGGGSNGGGGGDGY